MIRSASHPFAVHCNAQKVGVKMGVLNEAPDFEPPHALRRENQSGQTAV